MANNIVWSFGIALEAEDKTKQPLTDVTTRIDALTQSFNNLSAAQTKAAQGFASFSDSSEKIKSSKGGAAGLGEEGGVGQIADVAKLALGPVGMVVSTLVTGALRAVTFIAKGIFSVLSTLASGAISIISGVIKTGVNIVTGAFGFIGTAAKAVLSPIVNIFGSIWDVIKSPIDSMQSLFAKLESFVAPVADLDKALRRLATQTDLTNNVTSLQNAVIDLSIGMRMPIGQSLELAQALGEMGISLKDTSEIFGKSNATMESESDTMGRLINQWGLSAQQVAILKTSADGLGSSFQDLAAIGARLGRESSIAGFMDLVPAAAAAANDAMIRFGKTVLGDGKKIGENVLKTSAIIVKAFGKDAPTALGMAKNSFDKFAGALDQEQDVFLGLSDNFSDIQMSLLQVGLGFEETHDLMVKAQKDPLKFAEDTIERINNIYGKGSYAATRMIKNIAKSVNDDTTRGYLLDEDRRKKAREENKKEQDFYKGINIKYLEEQSELMRKNYKDAKSSFVAVGDAVEKSFQLAGTPEMLSNIYIGLSKGLSSVAKSILEIGKNISSTGVFKNLIEQSELVGESLSAAGKIVGSTLTAMWQNINAKNPSNSAKFINTAKVAFLGFGTALDKIFRGLPSKILGKFFPEFSLGAEHGFLNLGRKFGEWLTDSFDSIERFFSADWEGKKKIIRDSIAGTLNDINTFLDKNWVTINKVIADNAASVGTSLGRVVSSSWTFIQSILSGKKWDDAWKNFTKSFETKIGTDTEIVMGATKLGGRIGEGLSTGFKSLTGSFFKEFGTDLDTTMDTIRDKYYKVVDTISDFIDDSTDKIREFFDYVEPLLNNIKTAMFTMGIVSEQEFKRRKEAVDQENIDKRTERETSRNRDKADRYETRRDLAATSEEREKWASKLRGLNQITGGSIFGKSQVPGQIENQDYRGQIGKILNRAEEIRNEKMLQKAIMDRASSDKSDIGRSFRITKDATSKDKLLGQEYEELKEWLNIFLGAGIKSKVISQDQASKVLMAFREHEAPKLGYSYENETKPAVTNDLSEMLRRVSTPNLQPQTSMEWSELLKGIEDILRRNPANVGFDVRHDESIQVSKNNAKVTQLY